MPTLALSTAHRQRREGLPHLRALNVYWDQSIGAFFSRPGMALYQNKGTGPSRGMFYQSGLFNGDKFYISGAQIYREDAIIGTLGGDGKARFAGGFDGEDDALVYCVDGLVYKYVAGVISAVAIPDDTLIYDVVEFGNRFLYFAADGRFYWSDVDDPSSIDGASFATAEAKPDGFARAIVVVDRMYIFGFETIEPWYLTLDPLVPFQPSTSARMDVGAFSRDGFVEEDGRIYFVSNKRQVFLLAGALTQIADDSVLEAINTGAMENIALSIVYIGGREFLMLTDKDEDTYAFDGANWYRWRRHRKVSMNIAATIIKDGVTYASDMTSGDIFTMDSSLNADVDGFMERVVSAYYPLAAGRVRNSDVSLQTARGVGTLAVIDPQVELRYADDGGYHFSNWAAKPLGKMGRFGSRPRWNSLGFRRPYGRVYELRCTDDVEFTPQALVVDEARL